MSNRRGFIRTAGSVAAAALVAMGVSVERREELSEEVEPSAESTKDSTQR